MSANYHVVSLIDVNELLPFIKRVKEGEEEQEQEENKLREELHKFFTILKKYYHRPIHHIGEEKSYGKHLERYLVDKGGFIEIMVEAPLHLSAHFFSKARAEEFSRALKEALKESVPASPVRSMFIDSVYVSKAKRAITYHKFDRLRHKLLHKPLIAFFGALNVLIVFGLLKVSISYACIELLHWPALQWSGLSVYDLLAAAIVSFVVTIIFEWTNNTMQKIM